MDSLATPRAEPSIATRQAVATGHAVNSLELLRLGTWTLIGTSAVVIAYMTLVALLDAWKR